eukprot:m.136675 g.136675  ORF g.136675 m.136675 type:complete len:441 (+) comp14734_c0_seq15:211-1533(+)
MTSTGSQDSHPKTLAKLRNHLVCCPLKTGDEDDSMQTFHDLGFTVEACTILHERKELKFSVTGVVHVNTRAAAAGIRPGYAIAFINDRFMLESSYTATVLAIVSQDKVTLWLAPANDVPELIDQYNSLQNLKHIDAFWDGVPDSTIPATLTSTPIPDTPHTPPNESSEELVVQTPNSSVAPSSEPVSEDETLQDALTRALSDRTIVSETEAEMDNNSKYEFRVKRAPPLKSSLKSHDDSTDDMSASIPPGLMDQRQVPRSVVVGEGAPGLAARLEQSQLGLVASLKLASTRDIEISGWVHRHNQLHKIIHTRPQILMQQLLKRFGLNEFVSVFSQHGIDIEVFPSLNLEDLKAMGINVLGHQKKIMNLVTKIARARSRTPEDSEATELDALTSVLGAPHGTVSPLSAALHRQTSEGKSCRVCGCTCKIRSDSATPTQNPI